ncbi:MAG: hypothetical protein KBA96_07855 [Rhodocyclaceae bacterium]|nr:hypothetical protein [Rhodocyclaceae bacterium]MBP7081012.1 hypothetical protein [Rhodocyclaceae bacterium]
MSQTIYRSAISSFLLATFVAFGVPSFFPSPAHADEAKPAAGTVRPEVGKSLQVAVELLKAKKYKEAMTKIHEAEAALMLPGKTPHEVYMVQRVKGQIAAGAGDPMVAAEAFEAAIASGAIPGADKVPLLGVLSGQYYAAKQYAKCGDAANRYFKEGGTDPSVRGIQIQALYLGGDLAQASRELQTEIAANEQAGKPPAEIYLQMLSDIANRTKDSNLFIATLEKLVAYYPKKDYWLSLVYSVSSKPGLSPRLQLDVLRVKLATDTMRAADEYIEAAQLAIQAGFPTEAKKFLDAGYASGMLGTGSEAARHKRLQDTTAKAIAEDTKSLGQDDAKAATAATGESLINMGLNYVFRGQADKGLPMMEQAIKIGGFKRPDDAKLHYGLALQLAGRKSKAVEALRGVRGTDGSAELARLWILIAQRNS